MPGQTAAASMTMIFTEYDHRRDDSSGHNDDCRCGCDGSPVDDFFVERIVVPPADALPDFFGRKQIGPSECIPRDHDFAVFPDIDGLRSISKRRHINGTADHRDFCLMLRDLQMQDGVTGIYAGMRRFNLLAAIGRIRVGIAGIEFVDLDRADRASRFELYARTALRPGVYPGMIRQLRGNINRRTVT